jgi:hypothetical protein
MADNKCGDTPQQVHIIFIFVSCLLGMAKNQRSFKERMGSIWENRMLPFFRFFITKLFLINFAIAIIFVFAVSWGTSGSLDTYTDHGFKQKVPSFVKVHMDDLKGEFKGTHLTYVINDSSYAENDSVARGAVLSQHPKAGSEVKKGRKIYLTVRAKLPEMKQVPYIIDNSKRLAASRLMPRGFKIKYTYKPTKECKDCVLDVFYKGKRILDRNKPKKKVKIPKGSVVEVILGQGGSSVPVPVPNLYGKTINEANSSLSNVALSMNAIYDDCKTKQDSTIATIYKQIPWGGPEATAFAGDEITVYLKVPKKDTN